MKIRIIGGGPAGLYFAALMKREDPAHDVVVFERGLRDATWGFGVVFSDRALEFLRTDDEAMYQLLTPLMETWPDLTIVHNDTPVPITGNGFASIGRLELLGRLYAHAESLGVKIGFDSEVATLGHPALVGADLIVAANGAFSWVRNENEDKFGTISDLRRNRFIWYGTGKAFDSLSLTFRETEHGVFCAHHYRYSPTMSTFLVEVTDATWQRAGFAAMNEEDTIRHCEDVFARDLDGKPILSNKSCWRQFPAISNRQWSFGNVVLMGDALRTAHFSIGSGTRLAMEDAIALWKALRDTSTLPEALALYQERRLPPMKKILDAANASIRWYERMDELIRLSPLDFAYSYMKRTGRVDHGEVARRDPKLAAAWECSHPEIFGGSY
jgi:2-polyprenyl-6-methoxyphenol hydroxylase-like FAD-dependent oxidoreductase